MQHHQSMSRKGRARREQPCRGDMMSPAETTPQFRCHVCVDYAVYSDYAREQFRSAGCSLTTSEAFPNKLAQTPYSRPNPSSFPLTFMNCHAHRRWRREVTHYLTASHKHVHAMSQLLRREWLTCPACGPCCWPPSSWPRCGPRRGPSGPASRSAPRPRP